MPGLRFRLPYHFIVAAQLEGNPAFTVHADYYIAHAFREAIKLTQTCYQGRAERGSTRRRTRTSKAVGQPRVWNLQKVPSAKSCNYTRDAKFCVNVSSAQQFLVAHTYKLCHTTFMCMKHKRKETFAHSTFLVARRECATAFLHPWTRRFLLAAEACCMNVMGTCLRGHANVC